MALLTYNVFAGYEQKITVPAPVLQDSWVSTPSYLEHKINVKSNIHKRKEDLKLNTKYTIRYEVFDYVNCTVNVRVGTTDGIVRSANGTYSQDFVIQNEEDKLITFVSDGILKVRNIVFVEHIIETENIPFSDPTKFQNKSWTLSFSLYTKTWVSWHSYIPYYYIHNQANLYSFEGQRNIWKHNIDGLYQNYYGRKAPMILEFVVNSPTLQTRIAEDLTLITKARRWNTTEQQYYDERFITFNKMIAYNDTSTTGEQEIVVKDTMANPASWYQHQITNIPGKILATRKERNWNLNQIRNYRVDPSIPIFSSAWSKTQTEFYIDKVPNQSNIDFNMSWNNTEMLRDKFVVIRLKFDTFDDVNLIFNFSLETQQISNR